ncbi:hypothetical protein E2C01_073042 [Portunus trituberculatus]|uniref:Uncharacterized protein n=1 Tax=Portunus trituberculatus TaxID=210409 RepID=A0A5B7ID09_PORTR|nr:hypothetical protein [Portunus trituberculatus]
MFTSLFCNARVSPALPCLYCNVLPSWYTTLAPLTFTTLKLQATHKPSPSNAYNIQKAQHRNLHASLNSYRHALPRTTTTTTAINDHVYVMRVRRRVHVAGREVCGKGRR